MSEIDKLTVEELGAKLREADEWRKRHVQEHDARWMVVAQGDAGTVVYRCVGKWDQDTQCDRMMSGHNPTYGEPHWRYVDLDPASYPNAPAGTHPSPCGYPDVMPCICPRETVGPDVAVHPVHESYYTTVSEEVLADSADLGDAVRRLLMAPPATREEIEEARRQRREERAVQRHEARTRGEVSLGVQVLLNKLGWGPKYAQHYVQPYCTCEVAPDSGWERCEHAIDLGIETWH